MRLLLPLLALALLLPCCKEKPAPAPEPEAPAEEAAKPDVSAARPDTAQCLESKRQTGPGCDMEGIVAAVKPLRMPGQPIPSCYIEHVRPPRQGKLMVRFSLTPEGRPAGWQWTKDDFQLPALRQCLEQALMQADFPAPGDTPCQVVYPFTFVPEVRRAF